MNHGYEFTALPYLHTGCRLNKYMMLHTKNSPYYMWSTPLIMLKHQKGI